MSLESIIVVNTATGCDTSVEQQVEVTGNQCFIVRIPAESNAVGPLMFIQALQGLQQFILR